MIVGERIRFRAIEREDLPHFVEWLNDPEVTAGLALFLPMSLAQEEGWFEGILKRPPDEQPLVIEIRQGEDWLMIGNLGLFDFDRRNRSAEVGIVIGAKEYWNQGYGAEAMDLILRHAFNTLNLHRVSLRVFASNPRALRTYQKSGFVHEGVQRQAEFQGGQYVDVNLMSVLRSEWIDPQSGEGDD